MNQNADHDWDISSLEEVCLLNFRPDCRGLKVNNKATFLLLLLLWLLYHVVLLAYSFSEGY